MLISRHDRSHIVELEDGTRWRIWPGDIATTLQWLPTTQLQVVAIDHEFYSHVLINQSDGSKYPSGKDRGEFGCDGQAAEGCFFLASRALAALRRFAMRPRAYLIGSASKVSGS
jgi:hypothetical protein